MINDFKEAYNDMKKDGEMKTMLCKCGEIYFAGTYGEYSPGVHDCISPTTETITLNLHKVNSEVELHYCGNCKELLMAKYYNEDHVNEPDIFGGLSITIL